MRSSGFPADANNDQALGELQALLGERIVLGLAAQIPVLSISAIIAEGLGTRLLFGGRSYPT